MSHRSRSSSISVCIISPVLFLLVSCGSSGTSTEIDEGASVRIGGDDRWWVDAPITPQGKKETPAAAATSEPPLEP